MLEPAHPHQNITDPRCFHRKYAKNKTRLELEGDRVGAEVGVELGVDVDGGWLAGGVLHHEEELGHDLDDVPGLEDKVPLPLHRLRGEAARDICLRPQLSSWRPLQGLRGSRWRKKEAETDRSHVEDSNVVEVWTQWQLEDLRSGNPGDIIGMRVCPFFRFFDLFATDDEDGD